MTTQEMIDAFELDYDLNGSGAVAGFENDEILSFLNKAQKKITEDVFLRLGPNQLYSLIESSDLQLAGYDAEDSNEYIGTLPSDFLYYVSSKVIVTRSSAPILATATWVDCEIIDLNNSDNFVSSNMNNAIIINPFIFVIDNEFRIIKDDDTTIGVNVSTSAYSVKLKYIRLPLDMVIGGQASELSLKWHQDVVDLAVLNAMKITNDFRIRQSSNKSDK